MKKEFIGYYDPSEVEIDDAWSNGIFAFDTNSLLNLYRYTEVTKNDFIGALKTIKNKLFLPHQSALEFHRNRTGVIEGIENSYSYLVKVFENNFENNLVEQINQFKKHPSIIIKNILKLHADFLKRVSSELEKQKKKQPDFKSKDHVLMELTELFKNRTGKEFTKDELRKIFVEGKERYAEQIPPGYKDFDNKKNKGDRYIYGDLIIWKELINLVKEKKKPMIFVTDDRKEDWWTIENGKTLRPREELIKEFYDATSIRILIYNADSFLKFAKEKKLVPQIKDDTIKEIEEVRITDEKNISELLNPELYNRPTTLSEYLNFKLHNKSTTLGGLVNSESYNKFKTFSELMNSGLHNKSTTLGEYLNSGLCNKSTTSNELINQKEKTDNK